jgi:hypothetical protein
LHRENLLRERLHKRGWCLYTRQRTRSRRRPKLARPNIIRF